MYSTTWLDWTKVFEIIAGEDVSEWVVFKLRKDLCAAGFWRGTRPEALSVLCIQVRVRVCELSQIEQNSRRLCERTLNCYRIHHIGREFQWKRCRKVISRSTSKTRTRISHRARRSSIYKKQTCTESCDHEGAELRRRGDEDSGWHPKWSPSTTGKLWQPAESSGVLQQQLHPGTAATAEGGLLHPLSQLCAKWGSNQTFLVALHLQCVCFHPHDFSCDGFASCSVSVVPSC